MAPDESVYMFFGTGPKVTINLFDGTVASYKDGYASSCFKGLTPEQCKNPDAVQLMRSQDRGCAYEPSRPKGPAHGSGTTASWTGNSVLSARWPAAMIKECSSHACAAHKLCAPALGKRGSALLTTDFP